MQDVINSEVMRIMWHSMIEKSCGEPQPRLAFRVVVPRVLYMGHLLGHIDGLGKGNRFRESGKNTTIEVQRLQIQNVMR